MFVALVALSALLVTANAGYTYSLDGGVPYSYDGAYAPTYNNYKPKDYKFEYGVSDPHTGDHKSQWEVKENGVVRGAYSLLEPDGTTRVVEYIADDDGFRAVVKKLGHSIHEEVSYGHLQPLYKGHTAYGGHYSDYLQNAIYAAPAPAPVAVPVHTGHDFGPIVVPESYGIDNINQYISTPIKAIGHEAIQHDLAYVQPQLHEPVAVKQIVAPLGYKQVVDAAPLAYKQVVDAAPQAYKQVVDAVPAVAYKQPIVETVAYKQPIVEAVAYKQPIVESVAYKQPIVEAYQPINHAYKQYADPIPAVAYKQVEPVASLAYKQVDIAPSYKEIVAPVAPTYKEIVAPISSYKNIDIPFKSIDYTPVDVAYKNIAVQAPHYAEPVAYKNVEAPVVYQAPQQVSYSVPHQHAESYQSSVVHHNNPVPIQVPKQVIYSQYAPFAYGKDFLVPQEYQQVYSAPQVVSAPVSAPVYAQPHFDKGYERVEVHGLTGNLADVSGHNNFQDIVAAPYKVAKNYHQSVPFPYAFDH